MMLECPVNHPNLPDIFDPQVPNNPALWAVLQGRHAGRVVVDDLEHPTQCLLHTDAFLTYASRGISQKFLKHAIEHFRQKERIWLVRNTGDPPAPDGYKVIPRLEFYDYDRQSKCLAALREQLPVKYTLRMIDLDLLQQCEWRDDMAFYCGSLENFLRNGLGMCMMHGEEIIVEAYASALGASHAEIGAITHEPYRGQGLAPIAVAHLIENLEQRGYHAYWSCDLDNPASARVARKLGFRLERPYEIWEYDAKA